MSATEKPTRELKAVKTTLEEIQPLRALFLQEANCQIRYEACHQRGWSDSYALEISGSRVGYGALKGETKDATRDEVFEFYVVPALRNSASELFLELLTKSGAQYIECQTNQPLLTSLLYEFGRDINADTVLFDDLVATKQRIPGAEVRRRREGDRIFQHVIEPVGDYVLEIGGEIVATGGFMLHYNYPFADVHMEVREDCRRRGYGSFLVQEVKKQCYLAGRVPAARSPLYNLGSRATLIQAGMRVCGFMLKGAVRLGQHP